MNNRQEFDSRYKLNQARKKHQDTPIPPHLECLRERALDVAGLPLGDFYRRSFKDLQGSVRAADLFSDLQDRLPEEGESVMVAGECWNFMGGRWTSEPFPPKSEPQVSEVWRRRISKGAVYSQSVEGPIQLLSRARKGKGYQTPAEGFTVRWLNSGEGGFKSLQHLVDYWERAPEIEEVKGTYHRTPLPKRLKRKELEANAAIREAALEAAIERADVAEETCRGLEMARQDISDTAADLRRKLKAARVPYGIDPGVRAELVATRKQGEERSRQLKAVQNNVMDLVVEKDSLARTVRQLEQDLFSERGGPLGFSRANLARQIDTCEKKNTLLRAELENALEAYESLNRRLQRSYDRNATLRFGPKDWKEGNPVPLGFVSHLYAWPNGLRTEERLARPDSKVFDEGEVIHRRHVPSHFTDLPTETIQIRGNGLSDSEKEAIAQTMCGCLVRFVYTKAEGMPRAAEEEEEEPAILAKAMKDRTRAYCRLGVVSVVSVLGWLTMAAALFAYAAL